MLAGTFHVSPRSLLRSQPAALAVDQTNRHDSRPRRRRRRESDPRQHRGRDLSARHRGHPRADPAADPPQHAPRAAAAAQRGEAAVPHEARPAEAARRHRPRQQAQTPPAAADDPYERHRRGVLCAVAGDRPARARSEREKDDARAAVVGAPGRGRAGARLPRLVPPPGAAQRRRQQTIIETLRRWCVANNYQGINVDFENLDGADYALLPAFLQRMKASFDQNRLSVSCDLEATAAPQTWRAVSAICDFVVVMLYDEHSSTQPTPGPIASMTWYRDRLDLAARNIPREKLVVGLANYAYDWMDGRDWAEPLTYQGAMLKAQQYRLDPFKERAEDVVDFDDKALNPTFWYTDEDGKDHEVWLLDAITAANQWRLAQNYDPRGVAVWVLGSDDPSLWNFIDRTRLNVPPRWSDLKDVVYPYDVEFIGEGEIARVEAQPKKGERTLEIDPITGLAVDES